MIDHAGAKTDGNDQAERHCDQELKDLVGVCGWLEPGGQQNADQSKSRPTNHALNEREHVHIVHLFTSLPGQGPSRPVASGFTLSCAEWVNLVAVSAAGNPDAVAYDQSIPFHLDGEVELDDAAHEFLEILEKLLDVGA